MENELAEGLGVKMDPKTKMTTVPGVDVIAASSMLKDTFFDN